MPCPPEEKPCSDCECECECGGEGECARVPADVRARSG